MRYQTKGTTLCGFLESGRDVTVKIVDIATDTLMNLATDVCTESQQVQGLYYFDTSNIADVFDKKEIVYVMQTDVGQAYSGKIVIENDLEKLGYLHGEVYVNTELTANGDGTQSYPFNNINDAKNYAETHGIRNIVVIGDIALPGNMKNMTIKGIGLPIVDLNGQDIKNSQFCNVQLKGTFIDSIIANHCILLDGLMLNGVYNTCALDGDLVCSDQAIVLLQNCYSNIPGLGRPTISMNGGNLSEVGIRGYHGGLTIKDSTNDGNKVTAEMAEGSLTFDSSNTAGEMVARGLCKFVNETTGANVVDETVNPNLIVDGVWNAANRTLTQNTGLTTEEHDKLMKTSEKSDVYGAALL